MFLTGVVYKGNSFAKMRGYKGRGNCFVAYIPFSI
jgi:hypothetical protein